MGDVSPIAPVPDAPKKPLLTNAGYDRLKTTVTLALPAAGTLYFALAAIWDLPYGEQVVGTLAAVNIFLGVVMGVSSKSYEKAGLDGDLAILPLPDGSHAVQVALADHPKTLANDQVVQLKVQDLGEQSPDLPVE